MHLSHCIFWLILPATVPAADPVTAKPPAHPVAAAAGPAIRQSTPSAYWDPCVKPDRNGKISLTFYTADKATVYDVILEGITDNGSICRATTTIDRTR